MIKQKIKSLLNKATIWCGRNNLQSLETKIWNYEFELEDKKYDKSVLCGVESNCLWNFAEELWRCRDFEIINMCKSIVNQDDSDDEKYDLTIFPCFDALSELVQQYEEVSGNKKDFILAKGFAKLYDFEEAIQICDDLLDELPENDSFVADIRLCLAEWYEDVDNSHEKERENFKELLKFTSEPKEYKDILKCLLFNPKEDVDFLIDILKKNEDPELWDALYSNISLYEKKLIEVYEAVSPQIILSKEIYDELFGTYLSMKEYEKANNIIEIVKDASDNKQAVSLMETQILIANEEWESALIKIEKVLAEFPDVEDSLIYKGIILYHKEDYGGALVYFNKCREKKSELRVIEYSISCYLLLEKEQEAIERFYVFNQNCDSSASFFLSHWIATNCMEKDFLVKLLHNLKCNGNTYNSYESDVKLYEYILKVTENMPEVNRGEIRYQLIRVYLCVNSIKRNLTIEIDEIYHYSKETSLKYFPKYSEHVGGSNLRLSNIAYLMDPAEGKTFFEVLKNECPIDSPEELLRINEEFKYENTFLASFSRREDFLPMWVQYADDGTGCCYAIDARQFRSYENETEKHITEGLYFLKKESRYRKDYSLYKVYYYGGAEEKDEEGKEIVDLCKMLGEHLKALESVMNNKKINRIIVELIDSIRYLFKDQAYKAEEEVRIVQIDYYNEKEIDTTFEIVPHFYMDLQQGLFFNRVILGPKASRVKEKAVYLDACSNVGKVDKSKIKYV